MISLGTIFRLQGSLEQNRNRKRNQEISKYKVQYLAPLPMLNANAKCQMLNAKFSALNVNEFSGRASSVNGQPSTTMYVQGTNSIQSPDSIIADAIIQDNNVEYRS